jgi:hypothetical protein
VPGLSDHADALLAGIVGAVPGWVERSVERVATAAGRPMDAALRAAAAEAGRLARAEVEPQLRTLFTTDVDSQRSTPLTILREAVRHPTAVLRSAGVPPVALDEFDQRAFPDDHYGLTPATLADIDPELTELGIAWGAAKAWEHKARHRS